MSHEDSLSGLFVMKGFNIENSDIVKEIIDTWKFPVMESDKNVKPLYFMEISKDNEAYRSRWINDSLNILIGDYYQIFDKNSILKYKPYFKPLIAYRLIINNLSEARRLVDILLENNGYLPFHKKERPYYWEEYWGSIALEYPIEKLPEFENSEDVDNFLQDKFSEISKVKSNIWNREYTDKTAIFEIMTPFDISRKIPQDFTISSEWKELSNLELIVFNLTEEEIRSIAQNNNINLKTIEKQNY